VSLLTDGWGWVQVAIYLVLLIACAPILGAGIARVYRAEAASGPIERLVYRLCRIHAEREMDWRTYTWAILLFNAVGLIAVIKLQLIQSWLPGNPQGMTAVPWHLALNTAISFATNTNWQAYGGESTMSYLTQALGLGVQNFLSAATGIAVMVALARGFARSQTGTIGNAWVDLYRATVHILLPLSLVFALVLVSQGVVQTWRGYPTADLIQPVAAADGQTIAQQTIAVGPAASQIAIKQLGTNGGGFFNANSAHPFENPTPLSNLLESLAILAIPAGLCFTFGRLIGDRRQGRALFWAMMLLFVVPLLGCWWAEAAGNPLLTHAGVDPAAGNWEGKEVRFGVANSTIWATATTAASNGSVNAMHDSFTPLGGLVPLVMMMFGEVVFGGVGSGLYGMILIALIAVFVAGLMVGRTPEYLGKKVEAHEIKLTCLGLLAPHAMVLAGTALAIVTTAGLAGLANPGGHGFSEVLYALTSATNNNGSAFAGLTANTVFYDLLLGIAMLVGRYAVLVPVLAIAGSLARKPTLTVGAGTLPTHGPLFVLLLSAVVVLFSVLTFLPALALGPIAEHLQLWSHP
jgi:K+-transporting ATPase ATPase A chain